MRDPLQRASVKVKLALMFAGVCLLAFGVGGYLVSASAKRALEREIGQRLEFQSRAYATALNGYLRMLTRRTEDFASDGYIRDHLEQLQRNPDSRAGAGLRDELARHLLRNKLPLEAAFGDLTVVGTDGSIVLSLVGPPDPGMARVAVASAAASGTWYSGILRGSGAGQPPRLAIATPLSSLDGERLIGHLVSWIRPGVWVTDALSDAGLLSDSAADDEELTLAIADRGGLAIRVAPHLTVRGAPAPESDLVRSGFGLQVEDLASLDELAAREPGRATQSFPIAASGWSVHVERDASRALEAVSGLQSRFLVLGAVLSLVAVVLLYFPLRYIARPLKRMSAAARRLEGGDFTARVEVESTDEIGELAQSFNHMAAAVEQRTRDLERVADELRSQQRELRQESQRLAAVIAAMRDGLVVLDAGGRTVYSNRAGRPLLQLLEDGARVTTHHVCGDPRAAEGCAKCLYSPSGPARTCVLDIGRGVYEIHATRLPPDEHGSGGRVLVARDITDRVHQDERQIHQERLAVLGEVAAVMAHELNNPLAAISLFSQMMDVDLPEDSPMRESVAVIRRNIETCKRAVRELLDYATDATPEIGPVDVHAVLEDVARFLRPVRERAGIELLVREEATSAEVTGDEVQLRQIFVNLIVNALQAVGEGGRVTVVTRNHESNLEIDIHDDGRGIPPEAREQVFRPFYTTKARGEGTGLGLPTSRRIAEMHGGSLELLEADGPGTTFRVRLRTWSEVPA